MKLFFFLQSVHLLWVEKRAKSCLLETLFVLCPLQLPGMEYEVEPKDGLASGLGEKISDRVASKRTRKPKLTRRRWMRPDERWQKFQISSLECGPVGHRAMQTKVSLSSPNSSHTFQKENAEVATLAFGCPLMWNEFTQ